MIYAICYMLYAICYMLYAIWYTAHAVHTVNHAGDWCIGVLVASSYLSFGSFFLLKYGLLRDQMGFSPENQRTHSTGQDPRPFQETITFPLEWSPSDNR
jgi:hypothetical protein